MRRSLRSPQIIRASTKISFAPRLGDPHLVTLLCRRRCSIPQAYLRILLICLAFAALTQGANAQQSAMPTVGFESSYPAARLSPEDRTRILNTPLQDLFDANTGRYTMAKDDGIGGHWGLDAIRARVKIGPKPYEKLRGSDGKFQAERVIFADPGSGATMMMLSQIPYGKDGQADELNYFGKACWNADGSLMVYQRSLKPDLWGPSPQTTTEAFGPNPCARPFVHPLDRISPTPSSATKSSH